MIDALRSDLPCRAPVELSFTLQGYDVQRVARRLRQMEPGTVVHFAITSVLACPQEEVAAVSAGIAMFGNGRDDWSFRGYTDRQRTGVCSRWNWEVTASAKSMVPVFDWLSGVLGNYPGV